MAYPLANGKNMLIQRFKNLDGHNKSLKPNKNHICRPQAKADKPAPKPEPAPNDEDTSSPSGSVPTTPPNKGHSSSKTRTRFLYEQDSTQ